MSDRPYFQQTRVAELLRRAGLGALGEGDLYLSAGYCSTDAEGVFVSTHYDGEEEAAYLGFPIYGADTAM